MISQWYFLVFISINNSIKYILKLSLYNYLYLKNNNFFYYSSIYKMDNELEKVIKILNSNNKSSSKNKLTKNFRIRNTRNFFSLASKTIDNKSISQIKPIVNTEKSTDSLLGYHQETPIEEELITEIHEFYKEEDEKYKKDIMHKTGSSALWLQRSPKRNEKLNTLNLQNKKFLIFRPYIDPMSTRPIINDKNLYTFKFINSDVKLIRYTLEDNGFKEAGNLKNNWTIMWHGGAVKNHIYESLTKYQKINHFPRSYEITRKDLMYKNLAKMQAMFGLKNYDFIPKTFIMPLDAGQLEYEMNQNETTWIVKPSASSQGKGIFLTTRFSEIPKKDHVISKYIENPLLIDGLKFDLRIYVAITCFNPLRIYMYKEGLVRFATHKYTGKNKANRYMHLTNYSVNKHSEHFVENNNALEDGQGSKWSISALKKLFKDQGINDEYIWIKVKDIIIKTILSIEGIVFSSCEMHLPHKNNCFELLGFDILIDDFLNPWLLEVNLSPSMNCDAPIDQKIKGELISDLFTLAGIVSIDHRQGINNISQNKALSYLSYMQKFIPIKSRKKIAVKKSNNCLILEQPNIKNKNEIGIIKESCAELKRRGAFERIFPSENWFLYKNYFEKEREYNTYLFNYISRNAYKREV